MRLAIALASILMMQSTLNRAWASPGSGRERIAIAVFEVTGEPLTDEVQQRLRNSLRGGLSTGFEVVPDTEVQRAVQNAGIVGCDTVACIRRLGEAVFVRRAVTARIQVLGPSNFNTTLELVDLPSDKHYKGGDHCTPCTIQEVNDGISNAAASLKQQLDAAEAPPPQLPPPLVESKYRRNVPLLAAGGAAGALGVAGIIVGIVEASRNGDICTGADGHTCVEHRDTTSGIIFGFAAGVPLLVAGVVMTFYGLRYPNRHNRAQLIPAVKNGSLAVSF